MLNTILASIILASASTGPCKPLQGWEAIEKKSRNGFLIFGEIHGTKQSPEAFAEYVCAISKPNGNEIGDSVLIAIEFGSQDDELFRKAWEANEDNFVKEMRDSISAWKWRQDGVASQAMLAALKRLHTLKSRGHNIDITAFNGAKNDEQREKFKHLNDQGPHEAAQAENIRNAAQKDHYDHVVILVGNLHAQKISENWGSGDFAPMAMKLAETEKVITLNQIDYGGTHWGCTSKTIDRENIQPSDIICGESKIKKPSQEILGNPHMSIPSSEDPYYNNKYDGYYFIGPVTASQPVQPNSNISQ